MKKTVSVLLLICLLFCSCAFADGAQETPYAGEDWVFVSSYSTTCFVTVRNSTDAPVSVNGRCTASDAQGQTLATATMSIRVLGPGEETLGVFRFEGITEKPELNYELSYAPATAAPVLSSLRMQTYENEEGVTVLVTNTAEVPAQSPVVYCLFFDGEDELLSYAYSYLTDSDEELKPGVTMAEQLNTGAAYDHCRLYLSAYASESAYVPAEPRVSADDFICKEYTEVTPLDTTCYLSVQSCAHLPVGLRVNAIAYDAEENVLGAANALIDVIAPGEEALAVLTFYFVNGCDHIGYTFFFDEKPAARSAISDMEARVSYANEDILVTVSNLGEEPIRYASLTALFLDETGAVVSVQMFSCADDEGELKPGAPVTRKLSANVNFEAIQLFTAGVF